MTTYDFAIIGAGMAGASLAAELSPYASVVLWEAEEQPGMHATGRSAAFWMESYGGPEILPLTAASGPYLAALGCLGDRGGLHIARKSQENLLDRFAAAYPGIDLRWIGRTELEERVPGLRGYWTEALLESAVKDIDVALLHKHYLVKARKSGAELLCGRRCAQMVHNGVEWVLKATGGVAMRARTVINAAGAWADDVAVIAGVRPLGIQPLRRTMVQLRMGVPVPDNVPLVLDIGGSFYFKPEAGGLWLTPHDEHPSPPCDAAPEELDVAIAIDRLESAVDWPVARVEHKWAGLRSFAPDRLPVYGPDVRVPSFFWFAGQGGFGIQTAPAAARLAAQMLLGQSADDMTRRLDAERYRPDRFG